MTAPFTVLITGAAGNLGRAVTAHFAARHARLVLIDRVADPLAALAATYPDHETLTAVVDLVDEAAVDAVFAAATARFGRVDAVVHTVGGYEAGEPVHRAGWDVFERQWVLNTRPVYSITAAAARHMLADERGGQIVVVLARAAQAGTANHAAYAASKAAAQRIVESLAAEVRDHNINVNAVMPSTLDTAGNRASMPNADFTKWVTPDDVAAAIGFLASAAARSLHGVSLPVYNRA